MRKPKKTRGKKTPTGRWCETCQRDTKAPLFDGCMIAKCPKGYKPCL